MKKLRKDASVVNAATGGVTLIAIAQEYERYEEGGLYRATASGKDEIDALKNLTDKMGIYLDSETIDEMMEDDPSITFESLIDDIKSSNGDGCDFVFVLQDKRGKTYIGNLEER